MSLRTCFIAGLLAASSFAIKNLYADQGEGTPILPTQKEKFYAETAEGKDPLFQGGERVIIAGENRSRFSDANYPWRAFGKIKFGKNAGWICSATLVGPRHVVTNAHCVDMKYPIYFYPSYNNGNYLNKPPRTTWATYVYWGTSTSDTSNGTHTLPGSFNKVYDWAVLVLNESVGSEFGWLGTKTFSNSWLGQNYWGVVSYPNAGSLNSYGEYPLYQSPCAAKEDSGGLLLHDCDTNGGASGSGIWGTWSGQQYIIALNNWEWNAFSGQNCPYYIKDQCANGAVRAERFIPTLINALNTYP